MLYKGVLVRVLNLHRDQKSLARTGERWKTPWSHRILRIEGSAEHSHCTCVDRPSRSHHKPFRTQGFLCIESTAVQRRCARKSTEYASGSKIVGENWGEMENFFVTQDSTHRGFY